MMGLSFFSRVDWGSYTFCVTKTVSKKIEALIRSMKFLSPEIALYFEKCTIRPCLEYCCHAWVGVPSSYLYMLE